MNLADRIERRIREIPARNPSYVSFAPDNLGTILSRALLRRIAQVAADEASEHTQPQGGGRE